MVYIESVVVLCTFIIPTVVRGRPIEQHTLIDSCCAYSIWTQIQESIGYSQIADAIQIVYRNYEHMGLDVTQLPGDLSYLVQDVNVAHAWGERYPTSIAGASPYISYPRLVSGPSFGEMVAQHEYDGWFSSVWGEPVDLDSGDVDVHKVIGKQLPDGNIIFIGITLEDQIIYRTWDSTLTQLVGAGTIDTHAAYWGFDINGGIACIFYLDELWSTPSTVYYQTTTDGVTWSGEHIYDMVWPNPYANNIIWWTQMALTDAGNPLLVFNNCNGNDATYPYYGKVYVSHTPGEPCSEVSSVFGAPDTECFYPTIATGGNVAAVLYSMPRNNLPDSLNWWDFYVAWSYDDGKTWDKPQNVTTDLTRRPGLQQLSKRIDTLRTRAYYIYGIEPGVDHDLFWHIYYDPEWFNEAVLYFSYAQPVGVEEYREDIAEPLRIDVCPNPFSTYTMIKVAGHRAEGKGQSAKGEGQSAEGKGIQIYDAAGRVVKHFNLQSQVSNLQCIPWTGIDNNGNALPAGVYFVRCETEEKPLVEKVVKLR